MQHRLSQFFESLFRPRRVSIAIDDLPLFGERGAAVRDQVLKPRWLSPVWVELRGDQILAFGLWLPREAGLPEPAGQGHPDARDGHDKTRNSQEHPENPALSDIADTGNTHRATTSPIGPRVHARSPLDGLVRPAAVTLIILMFILLVRA